MSKYARNKAILVKLETTYGTDAVPTGAANAMQVNNFRAEPLLGQDVSRDLMFPYMGHQGAILSGNYGRVSFDVEIAGAGAAGTVPAYGPLLRACGLAETVQAGVSVVYNPVSSGQEACSIYYVMDGIRHILTGARGTFTLNVAPAQIPRFSFTFTGLLGPISDQPMPVCDLTKFIKPVPVSKLNTSFSLHGYTGAVESFSFDLANDIQPRLLINDESIKQVDRMMTGSATIEAAALATINWFALAQAHTTGALAGQHGVTPGNIVGFGAGRVQIGRPSYQENQKIVTNQLALMLLPTAGNDEFTITVK
ncbi:hypothetical protein SAMN05880590_13112 [Rhizobium sp. RU35A]|uniref:phage tail tube protein n=1 Tax=Rhizobium sp. RU35A TaxID=1907414 RepID=UPI00095634A0|nr:phage tail tube protein [Rhizobium sp. RU35A]SIR42856.1 hypothetical protein SAMN05880590_13112 [Rhizobium sp. RU35A]